MSKVNGESDHLHWLDDWVILEGIQWVDINNQPLESTKVYRGLIRSGLSQSIAKGTSEAIE